MTSQMLFRVHLISEPLARIVGDGIFDLEWILRAMVQIL